MQVFKYIFNAFIFFLFNICVNLLCSPPSGSQCHAAAAAAATCGPACALQRRPGRPPLKLSAASAHHRPHGQEAGGAGPHGSDAGDLQLHAGGDSQLKDKLLVVGGCPIGSLCFLALSGLHAGV